MCAFLQAICRLRGPVIRKWKIWWLRLLKGLDCLPICSKSPVSPAAIISLSCCMHFSSHAHCNRLLIVITKGVEGLSNCIAPICSQAKQLTHCLQGIASKHSLLRLLLLTACMMSHLLTICAGCRSSSSGHSAQGRSRMQVLELWAAAGAA